VTDFPDYEEFTDEDPLDDTDTRRYASLNDALTSKGIPLGNHSFIRQFMSRLKISGFHDRGIYIKAVRLGGGPDLRIHSGYTNGFVSEAEVREVAGPAAHCWPSQRPPLGQWGVDHPVHGSPGGGGKKSGNPKRDYGTCPRCHQALLPSGICIQSCDE
jgi:hypothetical protein